MVAHFPTLLAKEKKRFDKTKSPDNIFFNIKLHNPPRPILQPLCEQTYEQISREQIVPTHIADKNTS